MWIGLFVDFGIAFGQKIERERFGCDVYVQLHVQGKMLVLFMKSFGFCIRKIWVSRMIRV